MKDEKVFPDAANWEEPPYIPNYMIVDKARNERKYMLNEDTPDIDFLNSLSDESIVNLMHILNREQVDRKLKGENMKLKSYGICPYNIISGNFFVLLNKTSEESFYNFFKGKIEPGETIEDCASREFYEETGVLVNKSDFEDYFYQNSPRKDVGIYLVDWAKYQHLPFNFQEREIWSASWVQLDNIETSKNQQTIINNIELLFKPRKQQLRNIYFS